MQRGGFVESGGLEKDLARTDQRELARDRQGGRTRGSDNGGADKGG